MGLISNIDTKERTYSFNSQETELLKKYLPTVEYYRSQGWKVTVIQRGN